MHRPPLDHDLALLQRAHRPVVEVALDLALEHYTVVERLGAVHHRPRVRAEVDDAQDAARGEVERGHARVVGRVGRQVLLAVHVDWLARGGEAGVEIHVGQRVRGDVDRDGIREDGAALLVVGCDVARDRAERQLVGGWCGRGSGRRHGCGGSACALLVKVPRLEASIRS